MGNGVTTLPPTMKLEQPTTQGSGLMPSHSPNTTHQVMNFPVQTCDAACPLEFEATVGSM